MCALILLDTCVLFYDIFYSKYNFFVKSEDVDIVYRYILQVYSIEKCIYIRVTDKPLQQQQSLPDDCAKHETQCRRFFILALCKPLAK